MATERSVVIFSQGTYGLPCTFLVKCKVFIIGYTVRGGIGYCSGQVGQPYILLIHI